MNLNFDFSVRKQYHSSPQIARVITEKWVLDNMFCPRCGQSHIKQFENNRPVADFYCPNCSNQYELKSKSGRIDRKVVDGAYETMVKRILSNENPDFFFMHYSRNEYKVVDFFVVPKHFFVPQIIEKRRPLSDNARRAGWVGCNIIIENIPSQGKIEVIKSGVENEPTTVIDKINKSRLLEKQDINARGWLMDILNCVNQIKSSVFSLADIYAFEEQLFEQHSRNHNIRPKIRQQLQYLRDKGFIEFLGNGQYKKCEGTN
ncbi:MAG: DpnI domain-containing protein [Planctomycetia bacterium]|nr:DpnI domain-containing protein [Planctomycetia bacterium]